MANKQSESQPMQQLKMDIREKSLGRLYFFYGEEVFLLQHYLQQIKRALIEELTESFNFHRFTAETFDLQSFADAVENLPMMAEHTMVQVDEIDLFKLSDGEREKAALILSDIPDYCTVVFTFETTAWKPDKRYKTLWEAVSKCGSIVEFPKQELRDLIPWVTRHFASAGKQISSDLCRYLIEITGGTMTTLAGEISKIAAYSGADTIKRSDIDAVTEPVLDAVVFQITDHLGQGYYAPALVSLQKLLKMQQEPLIILGTIGAHFRRISVARTLLDNGRGTADLMKICGMKEYPAKKTMEAARRFHPEFCKKSAELILETDYQLKTSYDQPERLLELLILQLAQEAGRG